MAPPLNIFSLLIELGLRGRSKAIRVMLKKTFPQ